ncbi:MULTISPECIES: NAD(P)/FAD-dependent oxidoreductase [Inquilinus]|uniref:NAD(P)/FAD-dependent oxidoreductase n=1 Tax=unclassified Inquilinus TaxID=2645927 RepID=UPI00286C4FA8|nr:NAD(P)/FAD-dependent oxidoreductase [Inquilinus ginsengisoli]
MDTLVSVSPDELLARWLQEFDGALSRNDVAAAMALFLPDAYWRDIVAFTWNIHTADGQDAIRSLLEACLAGAAPSAWKADGPARLVDGVVEGAVTFETAVARGSGVVRLRDGRCWTLLTAMTGLKGHEEAIGTGRPLGVSLAYQAGRPSPAVRKAQEQAEIGTTRQPYCLVVGAGHAGLALGARLKHLGVPTLLIDRLERPSDTWRNRYDALMLHSPVLFDEMPYLSYPTGWPVFRSKDQVAAWLDAYAALMELDIWTGTECRSAVFDEEHDEWRVEVIRGGRVMTLRPKQLVFASGLSGPPNVPKFPGAADFKGEQHHASAHRGGPAYKGRRCVVVGANTSGHDICAALWEAGADVTMIQRTPTIVVRLPWLMQTIGSLYSDAAVAQGMTPDRADLLFASTPFRLQAQLQVPLTAKLQQQEAAFYARLEKAGFLLTDGEDHSGIIPQLYRRASGYYMDVGASELIANGSIKVRSGVNIETIRAHSVVLSDGSEIPADVIVYATGFSPAGGWAAQVLPPEMVEKVGKIYGLGSGVRGDPGPWEGELRNLWKPTQQKALWFHGGNFSTSRLFSRALALQIKAREAGIPTPVYALAESHHTQ